MADVMNCLRAMALRGRRRARNRHLAALGRMDAECNEGYLKTCIMERGAVHLHTDSGGLGRSYVTVQMADGFIIHASQMWLCEALYEALRRATWHAIKSI